MQTRWELLSNTLLPSRHSVVSLVSTTTTTTMLQGIKRMLAPKRRDGGVVPDDSSPSVDDMERWVTISAAPLDATFANTVWQSTCNANPMIECCC
jgi:hypothetical protein